MKGVVHYLLVAWM